MLWILFRRLYGFCKIIENNVKRKGKKKQLYIIFIRKTLKRRIHVACPKRIFLNEIPWPNSVPYLIFKWITGTRQAIFATYSIIILFSAPLRLWLNVSSKYTIASLKSGPSLGGERVRFLLGFRAWHLTKNNYKVWKYFFKQIVLFYCCIFREVTHRVSLFICVFNRT